MQSFAMRLKIPEYAFILIQFNRMEWNEKTKLSSSHRRSQGRGGQGARPPPIKIPRTTKSYDNTA